MELVQVPLHYRNKTGELIPITADPGKVLLYHIRLMGEGDWYTKWPQPTRKQSLKVNIFNLDEPLINEVFIGYKQEVDSHKELGTPIINPNPKEAICGYIYNCYQYPNPEPNIVLPPGFIVEEPDLILKKRLRRIEQRMKSRSEQNKTVEKDDLMEEYQAHLISKGIDLDSKEYCEKSLEYWEELGRRKDPLSPDTSPSRSKDIILVTPLRQYDAKAVRSRYRYLENHHPDFCLDWKVNHPLRDISDIESRKSLVEAFDISKTGGSYENL